MKRWYEVDDSRKLNRPSVKNAALAHAGFPFDEVEGKYPDWRMVLPDAEDDFEFDNCRPHTTFNPELLSTMSKAFDMACDNHNRGIRLTLKSETSVIAVRPVSFEIKDIMVGALMPMHGEGAAVPDWIKTLKRSK